MSAEHRNTFGKFLQAETKGKYFVTRIFKGYTKPDEDNYHQWELRLRKKDVFAASFRCQVLPGCCGILLIHGLKGSEEHLLEFLQIATSAAKRAKFGTVLLSLLNSGAAEPLSTARHSFVNGKTGNTVTIHMIDTGAQAVVKARLEDNDA